MASAFNFGPNPASACIPLYTLRPFLHDRPGAGAGPSLMSRVAGSATSTSRVHFPRGFCYKGPSVGWGDSASEAAGALDSRRDRIWV